MLRIFRAFRERLRLPGGTYNYLRYALGEIILVMIGILLAVQVNSWNEHRKQQDELRLFYKSLLVDLHKDSAELLTSLSNYTELISYNQQLEQALNEPSADLASYRRIADTFNPYLGRTFFANLTTLHSLESTGKLELLNEKTRYALLEYRSVTAKVFHTDELNGSIYLTKVAQYSQHYQFNTIKSTYLKRLNTISDERQFALLLTSLIEYKTIYLSMSINGLETLQQQVTNLISLIEQQSQSLS